MSSRLGPRSRLTRWVAALAAAGVLAAACTGAGEDAPASEAPEQPTGSGTSAGPVAFTSTGGDVFAWEQALTGVSSCGDVRILVDGSDVAAEVAADGDTFEATVPVDTGDREVVAECADGSASEPIVLTGQLTPRPTARIEVEVRGTRIVLDGSSSEATEPGGGEVERWVWSQREGNPGPVEVLGEGGAKPFTGTVQGRTIALQTPAADGEYYFWLTVADAEGREDRAGTYVDVRNGKAREVDLLTEHPSWIDEAVVYAPIAQLWGNQGFATIEQRLPYLKGLGVDALWLWPPVTRRAFGEEYAIADYYTIDDEWGDRAALKSLVLEAHRLGLRVMLDFVPNHSSIEHRYFRTAEEEGEGSHYWDFFDRKANGVFTHYFDWTHLPNLNFDEPQVRTMMTEAFAYWVREFGVDGFRVDAAWGIKRRRPGYWAEWREELKRIKPDLFLLGETLATDGYYFDNGFDVAMDWSDGNVGQWAWEGAFDAPEIAAEWLGAALTNNGNGFPDDSLILRFLNNNDTETRFIDRYGPDVTKVAAAMTFTLPGVPLMFAGDEIGANYLPYSNLTKLVWKDEYGLKPWYKSLIRLRDEQPSLRSRDMTLLDASPTSVVAYVRPASGGPPVLVVLNYDRATRAKLSSDPALQPFLGPVTDVLTGERLNLAGGGSVTVPMQAESVRVLVPGSGPA